ncbi:hypothetical protein QJQ45_018222, partial [Haematococcus lacustris]
MNWWPEAFPCRAAYAAVGLATRDYFPGKHGVLFLIVRAVVEAMCQVPMMWSTTCVMCLLFCRCWQCGALQQPGGYPQVDHHQPEQPQFDYEAELALVAQFQEQFHELDQALTALQPHPDPPAQPARTPSACQDPLSRVVHNAVVRCQGAVAPSISKKQQPQRQQVAAARAADKSKS